MRWGLVLLIIVVCLLSCDGSQPHETQTEDGYYAPQTGHTVRGEFLRFYRVYRGAESLGYPLTEEIVADGWTVQYFENGRLEFHPENEPAYRITVGWLGELLHRAQPPIPAARIPPARDSHRRYFSQTGHTLSGDFLTYFDQNGGSVRFGLPISEPFLWQGRLVQDLQSARFIWATEKNVPVTLEQTGRFHFKLSGLDEALLEAVEPPG